MRSEAEFGNALKRLREIVNVTHPDGQFNFLHLWAAKFPQAGRADYASDS
jgi:hypothetical protein